MCGIGGVFHFERERAVDATRLEEIARTLVHRGPDGNGIHRGPGYGLAHTRLAIVDRAMGAQPMASEDGRFTVVYNGEIYNHLELRMQLEELGHRFRTECDTEVLVHGYRAWGTELPRRLRGMFAFAVVDEEAHTLFAARDRLGQKPFYYSLHDRSLYFASELKALLVHEQLPRRLSPRALGQFLCLRYVPDPDTVFSDMAKLPPAHCLLVSNGELRSWRYWELNLLETDSRPTAVLQEEFLELFDESVRIRLMGEVPLAPFLSGGIDSYAVVESMARASDSVTACTVGFNQPEFDERPEAREAAAACGVELHEEVVGPLDLSDWSWFSDTFDEPFGDASAIPTYHVSRMARRRVVVALSGDGGDESFAGYRRYRYDLFENRLRGLLPRRLWQGFGAVYPKADFLPRWLRFKRTLQNLGCSPEQAYARSVSANLPEDALALMRPELRSDVGDPLEPVRAAWRRAKASDNLGRAMAADFATYLPGDILVKVDRASMAVSLEVRSPFLDHKLVEFAARIPSSTKLEGGRSKAFLRRALAARLSPSALARTKRGFSVPLRAWMAGTLGQDLERSMDRGSLGELLDIANLRQKLRAHRRGLRDWSELLWSALVLDRFTKRWLE
jgi:asparagine synthase (glutamine-hydrolysing)